MKSFRFLAGIALALLATSSSSAGPTRDQTITLNFMLGFMQQDAVDSSGSIDPAKLYFWMRSNSVVSGWIQANPFANTENGPRVFVAAFSCNAGEAPAYDLRLVVGTACNMNPSVLSAPKDAKLEADMYFSFTGNTEQVVGIPLGTYPQLH